MTHDEARLLHQHLMYGARLGLSKGGVLGKSAIRTGLSISVKSLEDMQELSKYIDQAEAVERELTALKKKVGDV